MNQEQFIRFINEITKQQYLDAIRDETLYIPLDDKFRDLIKTWLNTKDMEDTGIYLGSSYWEIDNSISVFVTDNNDSYSIVDIITENTKNNLITVWSKHFNIEINELKFY